MHLSDTEAAQRVADNDNLVGELVEALQTVVDRFGPIEADLIFSKRQALVKARAVLAKAQGAQQ